MSFALTLAQSLVGGVGLVDASKAYSGTVVLQIEEDVSDSSTDLEIIAALDISEIAAIIIVSDQPVTFETNSASVPDETFSLLAGVPLIETSDMYHVSLLATDWTSVFITNASGSTAKIQILAVSDATP